MQITISIINQAAAPIAADEGANQVQSPEPAIRLTIDEWERRQDELRRKAA